MGKLRQTALVLGEGPTEFFYFKSLCDVFKRLTIKPDYPKHTNIKELDAKIAEGVAMGYSHVFCIIDMDTKDIEPERSQYQKLKAKYAKPINKPKKGIYCEVEFFETHCCTELFFLNNLACFAQDTQKNAIFVHVKATYCSHKPTNLEG